MDLNRRIAELESAVYGPHPSPQAEAELAELLERRAERDAAAVGETTTPDTTSASLASATAPPGDDDLSAHRSRRTSRRRLIAGIAIGSVAGLMLAGIAAVAVPAMAPHSSLDVFLTAEAPSAAEGGPFAGISSESTYAQGPIRHLGDIRGTRFYGSIVRQSFFAEGPIEGVCLIAVTGEGDSAWTTANCAERSVFDVEGVAIEHTVAGSGAFSRDFVDGRNVAVAWGPTGGLRESLASPAAAPRPVVE